MDIPEAVDDEFPIFAEDLALSFEKSEELVSATDFRFFGFLRNLTRNIFYLKSIAFKK